MFVPGPFELLIIAAILFMLVVVPIVVVVTVLYLVNRSKSSTNDVPRLEESNPRRGSRKWRRSATAFALFVLACGLSWLFAPAVQPALEFPCPTPGGFVELSPAVAVSPDGEALATLDGEGTLRLWNSRTGEPLWTSLNPKLGGFCVSFSPADNRLAVGGFSGYGGEGLVRAFVLRADRSYGQNSWDHSLPVNQAAYILAFSPDGSKLAVGTRSYSKNGAQVNILDGETVTEVTTIPLQLTEVPALGFSRDGKYLVFSTATIGGPNLTGELIVWDVHTKRIRRRSTSARGAIMAIAFSDDGTSMATVSYDGVGEVRDVSTGDLLATVQLEGFVCYSVCFAGGSDRVLIGGSPMPTEPSVYISFVISSAWPGQIKLWDVQTDEIQSVSGLHRGFVISLSYIPKQKVVVTSGMLEDVAKTWNIEELFSGFSASRSD